MTPLPLDKKTMKTLNKLFTLARKKNPDNPHVKINNSDVFMPVSIELVGTSSSSFEILTGEVWAVAHYYEQNGDLMADPDMTFVLNKAGQIIPLSFQQDCLGIYRESVVRDSSGAITAVIPSLIRDFKSFVKMWANNIVEQQGLNERQNTAGE